MVLGDKLLVNICSVSLMLATEPAASRPVIAAGRTSSSSSSSVPSRSLSENCFLFLALLVLCYLHRLPRLLPNHLVFVFFSCAVSIGTRSASMLRMSHEQSFGSASNWLRASGTPATFARLCPYCLSRGSSQACANWWCWLWRCGRCSCCHLCSQPIAILRFFVPLFHGDWCLVDAVTSQHNECEMAFLLLQN